MDACSLGKYRCSITGVQHTVRRSRVLDKRAHSCDIVGTIVWATKLCFTNSTRACHGSCHVPRQNLLPPLSCLPASVEGGHAAVDSIPDFSGVSLSMVKTPFVLACASKIIMCPCRKQQLEQADQDCMPSCPLHMQKPSSP